MQAMFERVEGGWWMLDAGEAEHNQFMYSVHLLPHGVLVLGPGRHWSKPQGKVDWTEPTVKKDDWSRQDWRRDSKRLQEEIKVSYRSWKGLM
eukprot:3191831-Rhodomonas_salina.1